jgi:hypothetical protein
MVSRKGQIVSFFDTMQMAKLRRQGNNQGTPHANNAPRAGDDSYWFTH